MCVCVLGLSDDIVTLARAARLRWYGHVLRRKDEACGIYKVLEVEVVGVVGRGRPRLGWKDQVEKDMETVGLQLGDAKDRCKWSRGVRDICAIVRGKR